MVKTLCKRKWQIQIRLHRNILFKTMNSFKCSKVEAIAIHFSFLMKESLYQMVQLLLLASNVLERHHGDGSDIQIRFVYRQIFCTTQ